MRFVEVEAKSKEEAIEKAARELGVPTSEIGIEVLSDSLKGFFGLVSGRKVKIRAWSKKESRELSEEIDGDLEAEALPSSGPTPAAPAEALSEKARQAQEVLKTLLGWLSDNAEVDVKETQESIQLEIHAERNGLLIGKRGQTLDALQYLLNKIVNRGQGPWKRIVIDMEHYRSRREQSLKKMAVRLGEKAKKKKKPITIEAMNAHDRRIVHLALKSDAALETRSVGKGDMRKLVIHPLNAGKPKGYENSGELA
jgi:spoIIIJ-associated protein